MKLSKFTLEVPLDDDRLLLVGLRLRSAIEVNRPEFSEFLQKLATGKPLSIPERRLAVQLLADGIIVKEDDNEEADVSARSLVARALSDTFTVIMVPTIGCNLRCSYCFQSHEAHSVNKPYGDTDKLVTYIKTQIQGGEYNNLHIRWFGGEPLLAIDSVEEISKELIRICSDNRVRYTADVVTNGTLLTRDMAARLRRLMAQDIQVTFDGGERSHNGLRRGPGYDDTYSLLLDNLEDTSDLLRNRIRIHVAPYNAREVEQLLHDLASRGLHDRVHLVYFAPLFDYDQQRKDSAFKGRAKKFMSSEDFAETQVRLHTLAKHLGFPLPDPLDADYGVCTALREHTVVVNSDGSLAKCYMDAGDPSEAFADLNGRFDRPLKRRIWKSRDFSMDPECRDCQFSPVCLGGCTKQVHHGTDKKMICTPLKFNYQEIFRIQNYTADGDTYVEGVGS